MEYETSTHYGGKVELCFNAKKHHYTIDGKTIDGVTSVLKVIDKPALMFWAVNQAVDYIDNNLKVGQKLDEVEKMRLLEGAKKAHRTFSTDAAGIGTLFHKWIEDYINNNNPKIPKNRMLQKSVDNFLTWVEENDVTFHSAERKILSLKHQFCGTADFTCTIKGKRVLGDIKTSSGIWDEYWLQLAAYKGAMQEEFPDYPIAHTLILRCGKDGSFEARALNDFKKNYDAFLAALTLHRRLKEMKKLEYLNT